MAKFPTISRPCDIDHPRETPPVFRLVFRDYTLLNVLHNDSTIYVRRLKFRPSHTASSSSPLSPSQQEVNQKSVIGIKKCSALLHAYRRRLPANRHGYLSSCANICIRNDGKPKFTARHSSPYSLLILAISLPITFYFCSNQLPICVKYPPRTTVLKYQDCFLNRHASNSAPFEG